MSHQEAQSTEVHEPMAPTAGRVLVVLESIERRLARLEEQLAPALQLSKAAPAAVATVADIVDEKVADPAELDERLRAVLPLLERLTRPETLRGIQRAVDLAEQAPLAVATATDAFDAVMEAAQRRGMQTERLLETGQDAVVRIAEIATSSELQALLNSGMLAPRVLSTLGAAARAVSAANEQPPVKMGFWATLRAMKDPDVQTTVGFAMQVAARFGGSLHQALNTRQLAPVHSSPAPTQLKE